LHDPVEALRVVVAANDPLARADLAALLADQTGILVTGQIPMSDVAGTDPIQLHADVLVVDLGPDAARAELTFDEPPGAAIVLLAPPGIDVADAIAAGATGVLARGADGRTLAIAVRAAGGGLIVLDAEFAQGLRSQPDRGMDAPVEHLTPREHEVLQWMAEGLSNKAVAQRLGVSEHTVKFHVDAILGKLGAHSRTEAVTRAARLGWIVL
jgi:two-component system nitrate/nitrite response regulator NarL